MAEILHWKRPTGRCQSSAIMFTFLVLHLFSYHASAQQSTIDVTVDLGDGLIYFLVIFFFVLNFGTPIVRWLYVNIFSRWVEKASKEISKASKRFTERMSDASRRVTQNIRAEK